MSPLFVMSLAGAVAFFLCSGIVAYFNLQTLRENSRNIFESHDVIVALNELLSRLQDAETGQRGFLLQIAIDISILTIPLWRRYRFGSKTSFG